MKFRYEPINSGTMKNLIGLNKIMKSIDYAPNYDKKADRRKNLCSQKVKEDMQELCL